MLAVEEILSELNGEETNEQGLPPGFRFHPTDEELVTFYLASKVFNGTFCGVEIAEVDLNRCEPWELPDVAKMGEREWYFFSLRDRKYPTGLRTNRATGAGYWKATGKDREVYSTTSNGALLGMKKTLVFYRGRAPRGEKTKWVMHEYRLDGNFSCRHTCKEEWVICRIFHKMGEKKVTSGVLQQGQTYMQESSSISSITTNNTLPPLLETSIPKAGGARVLEIQQSQKEMLQNPFLNIHHHQESDLKSLINNAFFPINGSQTSFSPTSLNNANTITTTNKNADTNNQSPSSSLFKTLLLSHQDYCSSSLKEPATIPKQCKTEANFSHFQLSDAILRWPAAEKFHQQNTTNNYQNPLLFGMDCGGANNLMGGGYIPTTAAAAAENSNDILEMSTSSAFNKAAAGLHQMLVDPTIKIAAGESWPFDL